FPRFVGLHVLPGIICVILGALLLSWWELRRLTMTRSTATHPWLLPAAGITVGVIAFSLIAARFIVVHLIRPADRTGNDKEGIRSDDLPDRQARRNRGRDYCSRIRQCESLPSPRCRATGADLACGLRRRRAPLRCRTYVWSRSGR